MAVGAATIGWVTYSATRGAKLKDPGGVSSGNQQILVRGATEPARIVYGQALVSGPMAWINSSSLTAANSGLYIAAALAGHEIDGFIGWYLDDKYVPIADIDTDANGSVDGGSNDGSVDTDGAVGTADSHGYAPVNGTPVLYLRGHVGSTTQAVDSELDSEFSLWTSDHRGREVANFVAIMDRIPGVGTWDNGAPNNISAVIRGKKVYDPRLDSTFTGTWGTGSGAHRVATPSTWEYSNNPALCLADYLIDENLGAGADFTSADIDYNSVAIAADDCDDLVAIPTSATEKRFTCNGVLSCLDSHRENIEKLLSCMAGTLRYVNGLWQIQAGVWPSASSFTLTESDLVADITWRPQPERGERYNAVRGVYFDPTRDYKESAYLPVEDTSLQSARDDGLVIWKEIDLSMTNSEYMAQRVAMRMLEQASRPGICVFPMGYRGMDIAPGDRGTVTISELGWSAKSFRCIGVRHVDMVGVELVLKEDDSGAYADPAEGEYGTRTAASEITFPQFVRDVVERDIFDDFVHVSADELHRRWTKRQGGVADSDITLLTGLTDVVGGTAVRFGNNSGNDEWWGALTDVLMPYDPILSTYEIGVVARRNAGSGFLYCGVECVANDRVTLIDAAGGSTYTDQHFVAASGAAPSGWQTYRGYLRGHGSSVTRPANDPSSPSVAYTGTTFIRPALLVNFNAQAGQMDIASIWLRRLDAAPLQDWTPNLVNVTRNGMTYTKTGGVDGTADASVYSAEGYPRCAVTFKASQTNEDVFVGLDSSPSSAHTADSIDFAMYAASDGNLYARESGSQTALGTSYIVGDLLAVVYDGTRVRYYKNATLLRDVAIGSPNTVLHLDSSIEDTGAGFFELRFAPGQSVGTNQIDPEAATEVYRLEEFGTDLDTSAPYIIEDEIASVVIPVDSIVYVEARCNSCVAGGTDTATWTPYVGGTDGQSVQTDDGTDAVGFPIVSESFVVAAGTYDIGVRAEASGTSISITDRVLTVTVVKR